MGRGSKVNKLYFAIVFGRTKALTISETLMFQAWHESRKECIYVYNRLLVDKYAILVMKM